MGAKIAILLMGPPGVGKGTQAFHLRRRISGLVHFDTGQEIKRRIDDPAFSSDPIIAREREAYYSHNPNDTKWVADLVCERIRAYAKEGKGIILSGSPRMVHEAERVGAVLWEHYWPKVYLFFLKAGESKEEEGKIAKERALNRLVCENPLCGFPTAEKMAPEVCPECNLGKFMRKTLDSEEGISKRLSWYRSDTLPAMQYLESLGILKREINAEQTEEEILMDILDHLSPM